MMSYPTDLKSDAISGSNNEIEVPLQKRKSIVSIGIIILFVILAVSLLAMVVLEITAVDIAVHLDVKMIFIEFGITNVSIPVLIVLDAAVKAAKLKRVCTCPTVGKFVDYQVRRTRNKRGYTDTYAPKYRVFVNGRYEIRTVDSFGAKDRKLTTDTPMLVNPNGCEMIPENYSFWHNEASSLVAAGMFILFIIFAFLFIFKDAGLNLIFRT